MPDVTLRHATHGDLELMLSWRNHPELYRWFSGQDGPLTWAHHVEWFESRDPDRHDFIIKYDGRRAGSVWVTEADEVGIYIGEVSLWGEGVATAALETLIEEAEPEALDGLWAGMDRENVRSQRLFESVGFEHAETDGDRVYYEYEPEP